MEYDSDDYELACVNYTFAPYSIAELEDELYDYEHLYKLDQIEYEMSLLEACIVQEAKDGSDAATIERMEDELELLKLDYNKLQK